MPTVESAALAREIAQLESELAGLRAQVDEDSSSFSELEQQIDELRSTLASTRDTVLTREGELERKKAELEEARRLERLAAYEGELEKLRKSREAVVTVGQTYLSAVDRYDGEVVRLRKLLDEMRAAFGDDPRVEAVAAALEEETTVRGVWQSVLKATEWRTRQPDVVRPAPNSDVSEDVKYDLEPPASTGDLSEDLKDRTGENRAARILEYFNKS